MKPGLEQTKNIAVIANETGLAPHPENLLEAIAVIEVLKEALDMMQAGYAGMFGTDSVLTKDDAFEITSKMVDRALAINPGEYK